MTTTNEDGAITTVFVDERPTKRVLKRSTLVIVEGPDAGKELSIERENVTIGRSLICDLVLSDKSVSGTHFQIIADETGFRLHDLESTNGTHVGDMQVEKAWMKGVTMIRAGHTLMRFEPKEGTISIDLSETNRFHRLVGQSVKMREIFAVLEKVGRTELTVLVQGETGTGKELVAQAIHQSSQRAEKPFVVQDCGTIPKDLTESILFGHEKGAFTGATERHRGCFEQADGGTIFLDEVGELDINLQPKLLRVLETHEIKRVGGDRTIPVNVRVVAATNRDLRQMVNDGTFREDLYYRLSVVQVALPPLRERHEDIPLIVQDLLEDAAKRHFPNENKKFIVSDEAWKRLRSHGWPGNIREMRNIVERAASLADNLTLTGDDFLPKPLPNTIALSPASIAQQFVDDELPFKEAKQQVIESFESSYLKAILDKHSGNITRSAQAAGLTRYHLRELAKRFGIHNVNN